MFEPAGPSLAGVDQVFAAIPFLYGGQDRLAARPEGPGHGVGAAVAAGLCRIVVLAAVFVLLALQRGLIAAASAGVPGGGRLAVDGGTTRGVRAASLGSEDFGALPPIPMASKTPPFNSTSSIEQPPTATATRAAAVMRIRCCDGLRIIVGSPLGPRSIVPEFLGVTASLRRLCDSR